MQCGGALRTVVLRANASNFREGSLGVKEKGSITNKIYQELNNISKPTATRDLAELVSLGIFEIEGKGRTLRYLESAHNRLNAVFRIIVSN